MKRALVSLLCFAVIAGLACAQAAKPVTGPAGGNLESVLNKMDAAAANFRTLDAGFVWDQYSKVVDEHDIQKGTISFRRLPKETEMMAEVNEVNGRPDKKYVLFSGGMLRVYMPSIPQLTEYNASKNRGEVESFLVLGFGGRGHDLVKSFDVRYGGTENVGGVNTAKLELTPKNEKVRNMFSQIILWIDLERGISVQQQFIERGSGDYRLTKYSDIHMNAKLPEDVFKLKTAPNTKIIRPQG